MVSKKHLLAGNLLSVLEVLIKVAIKNIRASKYRLPLYFIAIAKYIQLAKRKQQQRQSKQPKKRCRSDHFEYQDQLMVR